MRNSKWSYLLAGINVMTAFIGAALHNLPLTLIGGFFIFWNWQIAEYKRSKEDESISKKTKSKSDKSDESKTKE